MWEPWELDKQKESELLNISKLPIYDPPCRYCDFFNPVIDYTVSGGKLRISGVTICHKDEMHNDFSCYVAKTKSQDVIANEEKKDNTY